MTIINRIKIEQEAKRRSLKRLHLIRETIRAVL